MDSKKIIVRIDKEFSFSEAKEAFDYYDNPPSNGKVILKL